MKLRADQGWEEGEGAGPLSRASSALSLKDREGLSSRRQGKAIIQGSRNGRREQRRGHRGGGGAEAPLPHQTILALKLVPLLPLSKVSQDEAA